MLTWYFFFSSEGPASISGGHGIHIACLRLIGQNQSRLFSTPLCLLPSPSHSACVCFFVWCCMWLCAHKRGTCDTWSVLELVTYLCFLWPYHFSRYVIIHSFYVVSSFHDRHIGLTCSPFRSISCLYTTRSMIFKEWSGSHTGVFGIRWCQPPFLVQGRKLRNEQSSPISSLWKSGQTITNLAGEIW